MRDIVTQEKIRLFLETLGSEIRSPARLYIVGGTSLVYFGLREKTIDIDITMEHDSADHGEIIQTVRKLKERLNLNIEEAGPGDFIPLPSGWKERCISIGRFGQLDALHFDPYSTALSKIGRGSEVDFDDVCQLVQSQKIDFQTLERLYQEILPRYGKESLRQDPERFQRNFALLKQKLNKT